MFVTCQVGLHLGEKYSCFLNKKTLGKCLLLKQTPCLKYASVYEASFIKVGP